MTLTSQQRTFDKEARLLNETAASRAGETTYTGHLPTLKHKKPKMWTGVVSPAELPQGEFTGGVAYAQRWRLPPPLRVGASAPGELVAAIGAGATTATAATPAAVKEQKADAPAKDEEEMDDLELMAAILGKN